MLPGRFTPVLVCLAAAALAGCDEVNSILEIFRTGPRELSDESAYSNFEKDLSASPATDVGAILAALAMESSASGMGRTVADPEVAAVYEEVGYERLAMREDEFGLALTEDSFSSGTPGPCDYDVDNPAALYDEYVIPHVEKIPVRNQGRRGTCAAFAAIGNIEYSVLNPDPSASGNAELSTLDLSEQEFYWKSKPECQAAGSCPCNGCPGGSWYGVGMEASADALNLDIPLEADCPYNPSSGATDTQAPLAATCRDGAVKVDRVDAWCGVDQLIDLLHEGYAIPYGSPLSGNWERTDGLITKAAVDAGSTVHAGGHAYLIVGYRKLPDRPEEGGLCFVVKNSWGTGWGVKGYACMTLAWMRAVRFDWFQNRPQPIVLSLDLRSDLQGDADLPEGGGGDPEDVVPYDDDIPPDDSDRERLPPDEPSEEDIPEVIFTDFEPIRLYGPEETYYRAEMATMGDRVQIRGILRGTSAPSLPFELQRVGDGLLHEGDEVGTVDTDHVYLCTGEYRLLCSLRYRRFDDQVYVQFRDDDLRQVRDEEVSEARGEWVGLGDTLDLFIPLELSPEFLANPKTFVRLGSSSPLRLSLEQNQETTSRFDMALGSVPVGQLDFGAPLDSELCSGSEFGNSCLFVAGDQLRLVPRNGRRDTRR